MKTTITMMSLLAISLTVFADQTLTAPGLSIRLDNSGKAYRSAYLLQDTLGYPAGSYGQIVADNKDGTKTLFVTLDPLNQPTLGLVVSQTPNHFCNAPAVKSVEKVEGFNGKLILPIAPTPEEIEAHKEQYLEQINAQVSLAHASCLEAANRRNSKSLGNDIYVCSSSYKMDTKKSVLDAGEPATARYGGYPREVGPLDGPLYYKGRAPIYGLNQTYTFELYRVRQSDSASSTCEFLTRCEVQAKSQNLTANWIDQKKSEIGCK